MKQTAGNKVNRAELAATFGVAVTTVDAWIRAGMPVEQRAAGKGKPWVFDTAVVNRWREQRAADDAAGVEVADEAALRLRKLRAETTKAELELAQAKGLVASVDEMERVWSRLLSEFQGNLRGSFVMRCATQLVGETDERTFKRVLRAEVDSCLEGMARMELNEDDFAAVDANG